MALGVLLTSGLIGFVAAVAAGLILGLGFLACLGVYWGVGMGVAISLFTAHGLWCAARRQLA